jgi:hypothetical protein
LAQSNGPALTALFHARSGRNEIVLQYSANGNFLTMPNVALQNRTSAFTLIKIKEWGKYG